MTEPNPTQALTVAEWSRDENATVPPVFNTVSRCFHEYLEKYAADTSAEDTLWLHQAYSQDAGNRIDYDRLARPFAYIYFAENYWKAVAVLRAYGHLIPARRVVDGGSGSAAGLLAYLATLESQMPDAGVRWPVEVTLVDRSEAQLALAQALLLKTLSCLSRLEVTINPIHSDLLVWDPPESSADVFLMTHVATENQGSVETLLDKAAHATASGGIVVLIERTDDPVWRGVRRAAEKLCLPTRYGNATVFTDSIDEPRSTRLARRKQLITGYAVLSLPQEKMAWDLLRAFFRAWETRSTSTLDQVFTVGALYFEKPFRPPLQGLEQIRSYWTEHVLEQKDLRLSVTRVAYSGETVFAEWTARFTYKRLKHEVTGVLILTVDSKSGRVSALHEYFRTRKQPDENA